MQQAAKDYTQWHQLKAGINQKPPLARYHEREVWWCSIGENVGFEQDGKNSLFERPVLVLRKFNRELFMGLPLTTKRKDDRHYYPITIDSVEGSVILSQVRVFSSRRLQRKMERLGSQSFEQICDRMTELVLKKSIPADYSAGSPLPSGNLYSDNTKQSPKSQGGRTTR